MARWKQMRGYADRDPFVQVVILPTGMQYKMLCSFCRMFDDVVFGSLESLRVTRKMHKKYHKN